MAQDSLPASITLKRNVVIRSIVTENFKKFMIFELNQTVDVMKARIEELIQMAKSDSISEDYRRQIATERRQNEVGLEDIKKKIEQTKKLELNSLFNQGTVEGFVNLKVGENFFEKLGAMEVVLNDGVVNEIKVSESFSQNPLNQ